MSAVVAIAGEVGYIAIMGLGLSGFQVPCAAG